MKKTKELTARTYSNLLEKVGEILTQARAKVVSEINKAQVLAYWEIGREIVEFEQRGKERAEYGEKLLISLSKDLTQKFGRGFSAENLRLMRKFYITYQKSKTVSWKFTGTQIPQTLSGKSETLPRKFPIRQTVSDEQKRN